MRAPPFSKFFIANLKISNKLIKRKLSKCKKIPTKYISVHFRNTDKKNNLAKFIVKIKYIIKVTNIKTVYLASDDFNAYNTIKENIKDINLIRYTIPKEGVKNLHYCKNGLHFQQLYEWSRR